MLFCFCFLICFLFRLVFEAVSQCSPGCPQIHYADQAGLCILSSGIKGVYHDTWFQWFLFTFLFSEVIPEYVLTSQDLELGASDERGHVTFVFMGMGFLNKIFFFFSSIHLPS